MSAPSETVARADLADRIRAGVEALVNEPTDDYISLRAVLRVIDREANRRPAAPLARPDLTPLDNPWGAGEEVQASRG